MEHKPKGKPKQDQLWQFGGKSIKKAKLIKVGLVQGKYQSVQAKH